jgi:hypothetical protein
LLTEQYNPKCTGKKYQQHRRNQHFNCMITRGLAIESVFSLSL